ncbi:MAG: DUF6737 family protein [Halothece sp.]
MMMKTTQENSTPSIWDEKPWWCQPWSIILTGIVLPTLTWLVTHLWWLTVPVIIAILAWWWLFLYVVPKGYEAGKEKIK